MEVGKYILPNSIPKQLQETWVSHWDLTIMANKQS
jgi:hypothetical protein